MEKVVIRRPIVGGKNGRSPLTAAGKIREKIAARTAAEFHDGMNINLGNAGWDPNLNFMKLN